MGNIKDELQRDELLEEQRKENSGYYAWVEDNYHILAMDFIDTLPIEDRPKTDDPDEEQELINRNLDEFQEFCLNEWGKIDFG